MLMTCTFMLAEHILNSIARYIFKARTINLNRVLLFSVLQFSQYEQSRNLPCGKRPVLCYILTGHNGWTPTLYPPVP